MSPARRSIHRRGAESAERGMIGGRRGLNSTCAVICVLCASAVPLLSGCHESPASESPVIDAPRSVKQSDDLELTTSASAREIDVGQPLTVTYQVLADAGFHIKWPEFEEALGAFEVRHAERTPPIPVEDGAKRRWNAQLGLMTFEEGTLEIPSIEIAYSFGGDSTIKVIASDPLTIVAHSVVGADADPSAYRDIKGAAEMPVEPAWKWWVIIGGGAALLAIITFAAILLAKRGRAPIAEPPLAPDDWARRELDAIEHARLIEQRAFEPFYVRLSAVVRGYVERRFGLHAPERTTDEFLHEARRNRALRDDHRELLGDFLRAADMVKFARYEPMDVDCREALTSARLFVQQSAPSATPSPAQPVEAVA